MLGSCSKPLAAAHDVAMLDLDGVVYVGNAPVPHAGEAIAAAREGGLRIAFITNNASRTPESVAAKIVKAGVPADADEVVTSAQAAARVLVSRFGGGAPVVVLGAAGLVQALAAVGLVPVAVDDASAVALVTGYGPDVVWRDVMRAAVRVRDGLPWVASNTDTTIPTAFGIAPGHGVMVGMLRDFTGVDPEVAGKPARPLLDETIARTQAQRPLMVGDRLDTDIEGAVRLAIPALLVMTGVTHLADLVAATEPAATDVHRERPARTARAPPGSGARGRRLARRWVGRDGEQRPTGGHRQRRGRRLVARGGLRVVGASRRRPDRRST